MAAIPLGRAASAGFALGGRCVLGSSLACRWRRRVIDECLARQGRTEPFLGGLDHFQVPLSASGSTPDMVSGLDRFGRFSPSAVDRDLARSAGVGGLSSGSEDANRPKPDIYSHAGRGL